MSLSSHKRHKIYLAATMEFGIGSEDPQELAFYEKIKKAIDKDRGIKNMGVNRTD